MGAMLISAPGSRFPRARLQPPRGKPPLRGLQTRAIPAGVDYPPLQSTILIVVDYIL